MTPINKINIYLTWSLMTSIIMTMKINDKNLLILGIVHAHQIHGYQITELINSSWMPIKISKANVYRILNSLEVQGLLTHKEERVENHPPKQVYSITDQGEKTFVMFLESRLSKNISTELPDAVSLNFLSLISPTKATKLLQQRLKSIEKRKNNLETISEENRKNHPGVDFLISQVNFEYQWLNNFIKTRDKK